MESPRKRTIPQKREDESSDANKAPAISEKMIGIIIAERTRFHRFVAAKVGNDATAEDLLQESLLHALQQSDQLRRSESAVAWFYRILRNVISDYFRKNAAESRRAEKFLNDLQSRKEDVAQPPSDWDAAVCACFRGLLPTLKPRYAEVIRRVDITSHHRRLCDARVLRNALAHESR